MQRSDIPKIQMPPGSRDVITRPTGTASGKGAGKAPGKNTGKDGEKPAAEKSGRTKAKRGSKGRAWVTLITSSLSLAWIGVFVAFSYGFYRTEGVYVPNLAPTLWAGIITAMLVPVGMIWLGAAVLRRLLELNETSLRLATVSRDLVDPSTTAANDVAKLGAVIRKELEGLNREIDGAVSRVSELESRLKQHTTMINETAKRVDQRTDDIANRLGEEREKVDAVTRSLSSEAKLIGETLDMQAHAINASSEKATKALKEAEDSLAARTEGLDKTAQDAADTTKTLAEDIERETGKLETVSSSARSRAEVISARYGEQYKTMVETLESQNEQQTKLEAAMEQQHRLVSKMTETVARQIQQINETVAGAAKGFEHSVEVAREKAADAGQGFEGQAAAMAKAAGDAASQLSAAADTVNELTQEAQLDLESQLHSAEAVLNQQAKNARDLLTDQSATTEAALKGQSETALAALESQTKTATAKLSTQDKTARQILADQSEAAVEHLATQDEKARQLLSGQSQAASHRLSDHDESARKLLEKKAVTAEVLLTKQADDLAAAFESSLDTLRARLTELADQGSNAMIGRAVELNEELRRSEASMRELSARLDTSVQGVSEGTEEVGKQLAETADAFEARMAQFPAHAADAAKQVHKQIHAQIAQLAQLASAAADKAQHLTQALEERNALEADPAQERLDLEPARREPTRAEPSRAEFGRAEFGKNISAHEPVLKPLPKKEPRQRSERSAQARQAEALGGLERPGSQDKPRKGRFGGGGFARTLADRLRPGSNRSEDDGNLSAGERAAQSTGAVPQAGAEDISDFRVVHTGTEKPASQQRGEAERRETPAHVELGSAIPGFEDRGWKQILKSMDQQEASRSTTGADAASGDDATFQRDALLIIEKLQALSIDLDRALEDAPSTELLDRYMSGERNVFARRLATFTGADMLQKIARTYREDAEFRTVVTRYIESFEGLLKAARGRDRENILIETYLTSQTGKVYMILGTATGHLK